MGLLTDHSKLSRRHAFNDDVPELTYCGIRLVGHKKVLKLVPWSKVNCGNCIARLATVDDSYPEVVGDRVLFVDSGHGGVRTVWEEISPGVAVALHNNGSRMMDNQCDLAYVRQLYGPLQPISEVQLHAAILQSHDIRLAEGEL